MFNIFSNTKQSVLDVKQNIRIAREAKLNRVREATTKRNGVRAYLANLHGVNMRRVVLMDSIAKFVGKDFSGRYVIKNRSGLNTKVNF